MAHGEDLIILGTGPTLKDYTIDDRTDVWGVNIAYRKTAMRIDKLFFFDDPSISVGGVKSIKVLEDKGVKLVYREPIEGLNIEVFPIGDIVADLKTDYFVNSICYMIAYALYLGYKRIRMFGVDMGLGKEQSTELPGMEYWVGFARGKGVEVVISEGSMVCKKRKRYGYNS